MIEFGIGLVIGGGGMIVFQHMVERKALSIANAKASAKAQEVKSKVDDEMLAAFALAAKMFQEKKEPKEIMIAVGTQYPSVVAHLTKKALKGQLPKGLEGLFQGDAT